MMNVLAAYFLAQTEFRYELFQVTFLFLNLLVFFPGCLIARALVRRGGTAGIILAGLLALNPMLIENTMYPWTKLLAVFYVVLGLWLYLAGWRRRDGVRTVAAFASFAAGALVHYSTAPYLLVVLGHYLVRVWRDGRARWREAGMAGLVGVAMLSTWLAWSIAVYGVRTTFTSNTAITGAREVAGSQTVKIALNIFDTLVPHPMRGDAAIKYLDQASRLGYFRDSVFLIYQTNLIVGMGAVGGLVVLAWFGRTSWKFGLHPTHPEQRFWLLLVVACTVLGVAVHGERETFGVAHVTLQPLVILGIVWLAAGLRALPKWVRWAVLAGCVFDFAVGAMVNLHMESFELDFTGSPDAMFRVKELRDANGQTDEQIFWDVSGSAAGNAMGKYYSGPLFGHAMPWHLDFLGDHFADHSELLQGAVLALAALIVAGLGSQAGVWRIFPCHSPPTGPMPQDQPTPAAAKSGDDGRKDCDHPGHDAGFPS
jgi:hypothetical protein